MWDKAFLFSLLLLAGCAAQPTVCNLPAEGLEQRTHSYPGVGKEQVLAAAEKLLSLSDKGYTFRRSNDELLADRHKIIFLFLAGGEMYVHWLVTAQESGTGTEACVKSWGMQEGMILFTPSGGFSWSGHERMINYNVFWGRMDYLLGRSTSWITCEEAEQRWPSRTGPWFARRLLALHPLCMGIHTALGPTDSAPEEVLNQH